MKRVAIGLLAATCLFYTDAEAGSKKKAPPPPPPTEISYTIEILDMQISGLNRHGEMAGFKDGKGVFINRKDQSTEFECLSFDRPDERYTAPTFINNDGTIVGSCASGTFGFIRKKGGSLYQFSVPGADGMYPYSMNDREEVVGEYYTPFPAPNVSGWYRFHSFLRKADGQVTIISAPPYPDDLGAPHSLTRTLATGINNRGEIVGTYGTIFTPSNESGMAGSFLYSNGQFTDLPVDIIPHMINNDGVILAYNNKTGGHVIYDDGKVFNIVIPSEYRWTGLRGINDLGQLFGTVSTGVAPTWKFFNVIATPVR